MRVFVMLSYGRSFERWRRRYENGEVNDETPYSYGRAGLFGCEVESSIDRRESKVHNVLRRVAASLLGFDLLHVLRNLSRMRRADVIWAHTEREHLAVCLLQLFLRRLPPVLGKTVWLMDDWDRLSSGRRAFYRLLMGQAACLVFDSPLNAARAGRLLPRAPALFLPVCVATDPYAGTVRTRPPEEGRPLRIVCVGNDAHRDWQLLAAIAERGGPAVEIRVLAGRTASLAALDGTSISVKRAGSVAEVGRAYAWADVVLLPLEVNLHASGITVALEAVAARRPIVATRTGGLDAYFPDGELTFVELGASPQDYLDAMVGAVSDPADVERRTFAAVQRVKHAGLNGEGTARRRVELSRVLLDEGPFQDRREAVEAAVLGPGWADLGRFSESSSPEAVSGPVRGRGG